MENLNLAYSIRVVTGVWEQAKEIQRGNHSVQHYAGLIKAILTAETLLERYLASSSQKLLLAPEYSTLRVMSHIGEDAMKRIRMHQIEHATPTPEDLALVQKQEGLFNKQLVMGLDMYAHMLWSVEDFMKIPYVTSDNLAPSQLIITTFATYTFRKRDIGRPYQPDNGRPHQLDESEKLKAHHAAMRQHSSLLWQRKSFFTSVPAETRIPCHDWTMVTDRLLEKCRGWEKELVWGLAALEVAESSRFNIFDATDWLV
ncbi:MAG: hypothetical protein Q9221_006859 [Calogaya cf. arnoldii]